METESSASLAPHSHHHDHTHPTVVHHHHYHGPVTINQFFSATPSEQQTDKADPTSVQAAHHHPHINHQHDLDYGKGEAGAHAPGLSQRRMVEIELNVLAKNNEQAQHNRQHFQSEQVFTLNLVSSPGSGKTTLLIETLGYLMSSYPCAVIEGDQQTANDAERIRQTGAPTIQINTGKGCHLDAEMVHDALHHLELKEKSFLFIENVGNLVCPASFDLGEHHKVAVLSVTEGADKPLKYPHMFAAASVLLINKIDLLPYVDFDLEQCINYALQINPTMTVIPVSALTGEGMAEWTHWLETQQCA